MRAMDTFPLDNLRWEVGFCQDPAGEPEYFIPATVPGAVQLDWAVAHGWESYYIGDNAAQYRWMEDVYWIYRARLGFTPPTSGERIFFVCGGVDYQCEVRLNGTKLHDQEGMFTPIEIDLTDRAEPGDRLEVLVYPAPKSVPEPDTRDQANQSCKPAVSYGWDFHPRLIPLGVWGETGLQIRPEVHLEDVEILTQLSLDFSRADITAKIISTGSGEGEVVWSFKGPDGMEVLRQSVMLTTGQKEVFLRFTLPSPQLWWPNGQGEPFLFISEITLKHHGKILQTSKDRIGFRRIRLVMQPDAWKEPSAFPKTRSTPPITLEVNGRRIFGKGSNWVSPEIFSGKITRETCAKLLTLVRDAYMNLLRCWGGAPVQKEYFFDICDEMGIMIWQEFPLSCNRYEGTPQYLRILDLESRSIIRRLRRHPCLTIWCGGNELFNEWSGMTDQDAAIRLLNRNCYDLDPERPFLPTAPLMGMAHGSYLFWKPDGIEVFRRFIQADYNAYTEFGVVSHTSAETIRRVLPEVDQQPALSPEAYQTGRARLGWSEGRTGCACHYFGPPATVEDVVETTQFLQAEGLRFIFEEARRQKPRCSMALNWCLNEPWPTISNCCIISWPMEPRPAYFEVVKACRPVLASARVSKLVWVAGEEFVVEIWLLSDIPDVVSAGRLEAFLEFGDEMIFLLGWDHHGTPANTNLPGPIIRYKLSERDCDRMSLVIRDKENPGYDSRYTFLYRKSEDKKIEVIA